MREVCLYLKRFLNSPGRVGSLVPSSKILARCMARRTSSASSIRILEVGAGSGAITRSMVQNMRPDDSLDTVECDPEFCCAIREQFSHFANVTIHESSILGFQGKDYDRVISSLPLNSFKAEHVEEILKKYTELVKPGGEFCYYEYIGISHIKRALLFGKHARDFRAVQQLKRAFSVRYQHSTDVVWLNFPPARIVHCKMDNTERH